MPPQTSVLHLIYRLCQFVQRDAPNDEKTRALAVFSIFWLFRTLPDAPDDEIHGSHAEEFIIFLRK
jgi:hypothetical protein